MDQPRTRQRFRRCARVHAQARKRHVLRRTAGGAFAVGVTVTALVAGVAVAAWMASGTGTGYAKVKQKQPLITESVDASDSLYPGATGDITIKARNNNPYALVITAVGVDAARAISPANCDITFTPRSDLNHAVAGNGSVTFTLIGAVSMGLNAAESCEGQTIEIPITLTGSTPAPPAPAAPTQQLETFATATPGDYVHFTGGSGRGQSFTRPTGMTQLSRVDVFINGPTAVSSATPPPTTVSVWAGTTPGVGSPLATQTFQLAFVEGQWTQASFSAPVAVPETFTVTYQQSEIVGFYAFSSSTGDTYPGGGSFFQNGATSNPWEPQSGDLQMRLFGA